MKLTIKARLFLGFSILGLLFVVLGIVAISSLSTINNSTNEITGNSLPSVDYAHSIDTKASDYRIKELRHVLSDNVEELDGLEEEMSSLDREVKDGIVAYNNVISSDQDRQIIKTVEAEWEVYLEISKRVISLSRALKTQEAIELAANESKTSFENLSNL